MIELASKRQIEVRSIIIMVAIALAVALSGFVTLYKVTLKNKKSELVELAKSQARLMEAVAKFDAFFQSGTVEGAARAATMSQIKESHRKYIGFGRSGELVLAEHRGDEIIFLLPSKRKQAAGGRVNFSIPDPLNFNSEFAVPMQLALLGKSGVTVALDHSGSKVIAAYEYLPFLEMGLVAKIDKSEILGPFIRAGLVSGVIAIIVILIGAYLNSKTVTPLLTRVYENAQELKEGKEELAKTLEVSEIFRNEADKAKEKAQRLATAAEQNAVMSEGLYELSERMHGKQNVSELAEEVIEYVARFLKLPVAALFVRNGDDLLHRAANYGYHQKENLPDSFQMGSGIIGQAAAGSTPITITDIPDYAKVAFGFGDGGPKVIAVYPLLYNERVVGVLELGSFNEFSDSQREWIRQAINSISMALQSVVANTEIQEILHAEWDESYNVGVAQFNEQHQQWFVYINAIFDSISKKEGDKNLDKVLDNLLDYTKMHFASEEEAMLKYGYPDYEGHKRKHEEFTGEMNEIRKRFSAGRKSVSVEVLIFLVNWLRTHIVKVDKEYGPFFNQKGMT